MRIRTPTTSAEAVLQNAVLVVTVAANQSVLGR